MMNMNEWMIGSGWVRVMAGGGGRMSRLIWFHSTMLAGMVYISVYCKIIILILKFYSIIFTNSYAIHCYNSLFSYFSHSVEHHRLDIIHSLSIATRGSDRNSFELSMVTKSRYTPLGVCSAMCLSLPCWQMYCLLSLMSLVWHDEPYCLPVVIVVQVLLVKE